MSRDLRDDHGLPSDDRIFVEARRTAEARLSEPASEIDLPALVDELAGFVRRAVATREAAEPPPRPVACRKGCDFCCHMRVVATVPEIAAVTAYVRANFTPEQIDALRRRIDVVAQAGEAMSDEEWGVRGVPCPFLLDHECTIYAARPLECRGYNSTNVDACRAAHAHYLDWDVPMHMPAFTPYKLAQAAVLHALAVAGLPASVVELSAAIGVALDEDDALARWLEGEPAFASAELAPSDPERRAFLPWTPSDELRGVEPEE